ncbi:MAG: TaqI-like C-terminal specificity domain-containing protein [Myxococcota bacterium]
MSLPDLSAAKAWLAGRSPQQRKQLGQWPTPFDLCCAVIERVAQRLPKRPRIVDPACGDGRWLVAAAAECPDAELWGIDLDPTALDAANATLRRAGVTATLHQADALLDDVVPECDAVVGNPPYVRPQHLNRDVALALWRRFPAVTDKCDLSACFVELACERADRMAFVLGRSMLSLRSFAALRSRVLGFGLNGAFAVPDRTFEAAVRTFVLELGPEDERLAGAYRPSKGQRSAALEVTGTLGISREAWSLDGPPPELPGTPLGDVARFHMGVVCGDYARYVHQGPPGPLDEPTCRGRDVSRFRIADRGEWLHYDPTDMLARKPYVAPKSREIFDVAEKIVVAGTTGRRIVAAMDERRRFPLDSCYVVHSRPDIDLWAVLGWLASPVVGAWYAARFGAPRVKAIELAGIPLPPQDYWGELGAAVREQDEPAIDRMTRAAVSAMRFIARS